MIRITNADEFVTAIRKWVGAVRTQTEKVSISIAYDMLSHLLLTAPQYSGQFVASWNASVGSPNYTSHEPPHLGPHQEGEPLAIRTALSRFNLAGFTLGERIFLANSVSHDEPYSVLIEENAIEFRPVNPSRGAVVARALNRARHEYANLTRTKVAALIGA